tara:strand:+ start:69 stop:341 length:273 start_codon:yes stop_codon:yes gene_type:complete
MMIDNKENETKSEIYTLLAAFETKKEVVKVNDKYAARYKKWWQISWRYIGIDCVWGKSKLNRDYVLENTEEEAFYKLKKWFPIVVKTNCC